MRKQDYAGFPGTKFYFTEADPSSQRWYGITGNLLGLELKLWLLLADHLILSVGHMVKSDQTFTWLRENTDTVSEFAKSGALLASLSDRYRNCREYARDQVRIPDHTLHGADLLCSPEDRAMFLDDIFPVSITWPASGESQRFREMLVHDLADPTSPLRQRARGVPNELSRAILETDDFTRGKLTSLVREYCPKKESIITRYGDCFYYLSGAQHKDAFPVMHAKAANLCREKISHAVHQRGGEASTPFWHEIVDAWGVTLSAMDRLSLEEVLDIRGDDLGKRVRETWGRIVNDARRGLTTCPQLSQVEEFQRRLVALFSTNVNTQSKRHKRWSVGRSFLQVGSWATGGIGIAAGLLFGSVASFAVGVSSFLAGAPIAKKAEQRFASTELVLLAEKIRDPRRMK